MHEDPVKNVDAIRTLFAAINEGTFEQVVTSLAAPHFVRHDLTGAIPGVRGKEGARNFLAQLRERFSDLRVSIDDIFSAGDKVVVRFVLTGYETRDSKRKQVAVNNINIYRFENGQVVETWQLADALSLERQLGS
jgi:ketosteroid isomerase-like protein